MAWGCKFDASPDIWKGVVVDAQQEPSSPRFDLERDRNARTFEGKESIDKLKSLFLRTGRIDAGYFHNYLRIFRSFEFWDANLLGF